jgi:phytanoyl-CoA hydroxylase
MAAKRMSVLKNHLQGSRSVPSAGLISVAPHISTSPLTPEDLAHYEQNGFLVVPKLYRQEELDVYRERFIELCSGTGLPKPPLLRFMKDVASVDQPMSEYTVNKIQDFQLDDVLSIYCSHPLGLDVVESLIGSDIMAMHTMLINKPPDTGKNTSRHPLHQDLWYFPFRPADRIVCAWTAIEKVHRGNGCLVVYPGTHKGELLNHSYPEWKGGVNKMYHGIKDMPTGVEPLYLEMEPGDTVFFHPLLIHGSGANKTAGFRKAISCHYASSRCDYIDITGTPQDSVAKEVKEIVKKKFKGIELSYEVCYRPVCHPGLYYYYY